MREPTESELRTAKELDMTPEWIAHIMDVRSRHIAEIAQEIVDADTAQFRKRIGYID